MAYDTEELYNKALEVIEDKGLYFVEDVTAYLGIAKSTFYDHFPEESNQSNDIKDALQKNRIQVKVKMRTKWYESDNATLQMGLMKLLSSEYELRKLSMQHTKHSGGVDLNPPQNLKELYDAEAESES